MSKVAPWLSLSIDWQDSEMFDGASHGVRLAWICLLCFVKAQGRAGKVRFRDKVFAEKYRLAIESVNELLERTGRDGAVVVEGDYVTVVNWKSYQDPRARSKDCSKHKPRKHARSKRRHFSETYKNDATHHPPPSTHHPPPPSDGWEGVEEVLFGHGIAKAPEAVKAVRDAGCTVIQVQNVVEFWRARQPAWGPGALYDRLLRLRPNQPFDQHWPDCVSDNGRRQVTADEFKRLFSEGKFTSKPQHHATKPEIVFGTLRTGEKIECRDYPLKKKLA